jgi:hypothetical protein
MSKKKRTSIKILTPTFRASFANVWTPKPINNSVKLYYSVAMLFDAKAQATPEFKKLRAGIQQIIKDDFGGKTPPRFWNPLQKGDEKDYEGYKGMIFINAKSEIKPGVVGPDTQDILDPNDFYSGCFARATISLFPFNTAGNVGVGVGLQNLQKLKDGEPLSGRTKASDDFEEAYDDLDNETASDDFEN